METTCAVCRLSDGLVMNIIMASPSDLPPNGCQLVEIMTGQSCNIGWFYVNDTFNGPKTYAMCDDTTNEVVSFFYASFVSPVPTAPTGYYGIEVPTGTECGIGWTWDGVSFIPPVA
jgi:hypothetical protein